MQARPQPLCLCLCLPKPLVLAVMCSTQCSTLLTCLPCSCLHGAYCRRAACVSVSMMYSLVEIGMPSIACLHDGAGSLEGPIFCRWIYVLGDGAEVEATAAGKICQGCCYHKVQSHLLHFNCEQAWSALNQAQRNGDGAHLQATKRCPSPAFISHIHCLDCAQLHHSALDVVPILSIAPAESMIHLNGFRNVRPLPAMIFLCRVGNVTTAITLRPHCCACSGSSLITQPVSAQLQGACVGRGHQ